MPSWSLARKKRAELESLDIFEIPHVPDDYPLNKLQRTVRHSVINECEHISPELARVLRAVDYPLYYLDFETFSPAIPRFAGTRPYSQIPFQFSVHREDGAGGQQHFERWPGQPGRCRHVI